MSKYSSQLVSILLLILIIAGSVFFVLPMRENIASLKEEKSVADENLLTLQSQYDELNALSQEIAKSKSIQETLQKAVPVGIKQDELILELTDMAESLDFEVKVLSFSMRRDATYGNVISLSMSLNGTSDALIEYLQMLEAADRLLNVTSISIQQNNTESITFGVNLDVYYQ